MSAQSFLDDLQGELKSRFESDRALFRRHYQADELLIVHRRSADRDGAAG